MSLVARDDGGDGFGGVAGEFGQDVGVGVCGDRDGGVAEQLLHDFEVRSGGDHEGGRAVA